MITWNYKFYCSQIFNWWFESKCGRLFNVFPHKLALKIHMLTNVLISNIMELKTERTHSVSLIQTHFAVPISLCNHSHDFTILNPMFTFCPLLQMEICFKWAFILAESRKKLLIIFTLCENCVHGHYLNLFVLIPILFFTENTFFTSLICIIFRQTSHEVKTANLL